MIKGIHHRISIALAILTMGGLTAVLAFRFLLSPFLNGQPTLQTSQVAAYLLLVLIVGTYLAVVTYRQRAWWLTALFATSVTLSAASLPTDLDASPIAAWSIGLFGTGAVLWLIVRWRVLVAPTPSERGRGRE